jgi:hypothetical protein
MKTRWFRDVYKLKLIYILDLALTNFFFITKVCLSKSYKIYLLIILDKCTRKLSNAGVIKRINSRKKSLLTTINTIYIYIIYFRSNHLNFSTLIRETSALYEACEAVLIITATKGVREEEGVGEKKGEGKKEGVGEEKGAGEEKSVGEKVTILLISLSLSSLRLIRCAFDR